MRSVTRPIPRTLRSLGLILLVLTLLGSTVFAATQSGSSQASEARDGSPILSFAPAEGWNTVETNVGPEPGSLPVAWAANVLFRAEDSFVGFPDNTIRSLAPDAIVITAVGPRRYTGDVAFPQLKLPLNLADGRFLAREYEGQPAPNVSMFLIEGKVGDQLLNVTVWMGTSEPSERMIEAANAELSRLSIPQ